MEAKDKPPLVTDDDIKKLCIKHLGWDEPVSERDLSLVKPLFQAQLDTCIKHMRGSK